MKHLQITLALGMSAASEHISDYGHFLWPVDSGGFLWPTAELENPHLWRKQEVLGHFFFTFSHALFSRNTYSRSWGHIIQTHVDFLDLSHITWIHLHTDTRICYELYWTNPGSNIPRSSSCAATYLLSLKPTKDDEHGMWDNAGEAKMNS